MGKYQGLLIVLCIVTYNYITECSHCREQLFQKERNKKFIPDNRIPGSGYLTTHTKRSAADCNAECLKTPKCGKTNVRKLGARNWECVLFGWGTGETEDSPYDHHYTMINEPCEGCFISNIYNGSTYFFDKGPLNWTDAELQCLKYRSVLVTIETEDEQTALVNYIKNSEFGSLLSDQWGYYIGLNDRDEENRYIWTGSWIPAGYVAWDPSDKGSQDERCIVMQKHFYLWHDYPCDGNLGYICER